MQTRKYLPGMTPIHPANRWGSGAGQGGNTVLAARGLRVSCPQAPSSLPSCSPQCRWGWNPLASGPAISSGVLLKRSWSETRERKMPGLSSPCPPCSSRALSPPERSSGRVTHRALPLSLQPRGGGNFLLVLIAQGLPRPLLVPHQWNQSRIFFPSVFNIRRCFHFPRWNLPANKVKLSP